MKTTLQKGTNGSVRIQWGGLSMGYRKREVLDKERDLISDQRERILWDAGCAQLLE